MVGTPFPHHFQVDFLLTILILSRSLDHHPVVLRVWLVRVETRWYGHFTGRQWVSKRSEFWLLFLLAGDKSLLDWRYFGKKKFKHLIILPVPEPEDNRQYFSLENDSGYWLSSNAQTTSIGNRSSLWTLFGLVFFFSISYQNIKYSLTLEQGSHAFVNSALCPNNILLPRPRTYLMGHCLE